MKQKNLLFFFTIFFLATQLLFSQNDVKCPATRDVWLSTANKDEINSNGGKSEKIKLKIYQEFGFFDFDVSALKGKKIKSAVLYLGIIGAGTDKERGTDLRWITISTISGDWVEGEGVTYDIDEKGKGATSQEASYKTKPWSYPGSRCYDVILGNGNTIRQDVDAGDPKNGWLLVPLDSALVSALLTKASYGLCVMDGSTGIDRNCTVGSRENRNKAPYLQVEIEEESSATPAAVENLTATPANNEASDTHGAISLSFKTPSNAFSYDIKINGIEIPRYQIPFAAKPGSSQKIVIDNLPANTDAEIEIRTVDAAGRTSEPAKCKTKISPIINVPNIASKKEIPKLVEPTTNIWVMPEGSKINPVDGKTIDEKSIETNANENSIWNATTKTITIVSAKGDITGIQLVFAKLTNPNAQVKIECKGLEPIASKIFRTWYVKTGDIWQPEFALPVDAGKNFTLTDPKNVINGQTNATVAIDLIVSEKTKEGHYKGEIIITHENGTTEKLAIHINVVNATIPSEINFNPELNCYGGPATAGSDKWFDSFRLAHYNRCTINRVPYSQNGKAHDDYIPAIDSNGKVTNWSNFDKNMGPLLDGSAFKDNPRSGVPIPTFYLPHHEDWPMSFHENYQPGVATDAPQWKVMHDLKGKPPEDAFTQKFKDGYKQSVAEFATHFDEKGWDKTIFEFYFNNKFNQKGMTGTAWVMDEPAEYLDWRALNFFAALGREGAKTAKKCKILFRADVSRPMWQGSVSNGLIDLMYVNSEMYSFLPLIKNQKKNMPAIFYNYGETNPMSQTNLTTTAWCLKAYVNECDGVLPWQSIAGDNAFDAGDPKGGGNALIVDGSKRFGINAVGSYRLFALRNGAQISELLRLIEIKKGWGRNHSKALVSQLVPLSSEFKQSFADDAAAISFKGLNADNFVYLKQGLLKILTQP